MKKNFVSIGTALALVLVLALMPMTSSVMADEDTAVGKFNCINIAPIVVTPTVTDMTPQTVEWVNVTVTDYNRLSDLATVEAVLFWDTGGSYNDPGASPTAHNQTLVIMTWYASNNTFAIQGGASTSWSIDNATSSHPGLSGYTGDWKFSFQPGKVATETDSDKWFTRVNATDDDSEVGSNYSAAATMEFYSEINVGPAMVDFGSVDLGSNFTDNSETASITNIANGNYNESSKTDNGTATKAHWDNVTEELTVALDADGTPVGGEFSLAIDDTTTLSSSVNMSVSYQVINSAGVQTYESGYPAGNHGLWLAMGSTGIIAATYNGTIYFQIVNR